MNPQTEEKFSPILEICALEFSIAVKDLDARHQELMADLQYPKSVEPMRIYILERFDLLVQLLRKLVEQHVEYPGIERAAAAEAFLNKLSKMYIRDLEAAYEYIPVEWKRDIISSVDLKLNAKISRLIAHMRRMQYKALTANPTEPLAQRAVSTRPEVTLSTVPSVSIEDAHGLVDPAPVAEPRTSAPEGSTVADGGRATPTPAASAESSKGVLDPVKSHAPGEAPGVSTIDSFGVGLSLAHSARWVSSFPADYKRPYPRSSTGCRRWRCIEFAKGGGWSQREFPRGGAGA
jgi:hypothetical protein